MLQIQEQQFALNSEVLVLNITPPPPEGQKSSDQIQKDGIEKKRLAACKAATKYRDKEKAEKEANIQKVAELESDNQDLKAKVCTLLEENNRLLRALVSLMERFNNYLCALSSLYFQIGTVLRVYCIFFNYN
ncbi:hypothetical protein BGZ60DRAFT_515458 [Tricladium varicosporioides]|nr:hypothetical protein BGZ60DRAFT_515458 [Hymenoscyphus varicosporioides]